MVLTDANPTGEIYAKDDNAFPPEISVEEVLWFGMRSQNNTTIHASRSTKTWLEDNDVDTMDWSSRSPDLNPMENLWAILVRRIYADNRQFETTKDLQCAICKAWSEVDKSAIKNLVNSMPERIFQVINRSGSCTDN
uniref:DDE_3 domain-containing protein n=1 Tax=Heterorhabditis bacteriophora TaxID=37862 RepID=A0A1I7X9P3_HETBA